MFLLPTRLQNSQIPFWVFQNESQKIPGSIVTSKGTIGFPAGSIGSPGSNDFYLQTPATIAGSANIAKLMGAIIPQPGRMYKLKKIKVAATGFCFVQINIKRNLAYSLANPTGISGSVVLDGVQDERILSLSAPSQLSDPMWRGVFDFGEEGLILRSGDRAELHYWCNSDTGLNWMFDFGDGANLTDDTNYDAAKTAVFFGDSITVPVAEDSANKASLWTYGIINKYISKGINVRQVNMAQGGSDSNFWEWWICRQMKFAPIKGDIYFCGVGTNDAAGTNALSYYKQALKNIVDGIYTHNPGKPVIFHGLTNSNTAGRVTNLPAYRDQLTQAVAEMQAAGKNVYFANTSNAVTVSETPSKYVETAANSQLHPNTLGQAIIRDIIWNTCKDLLNAA